MAEGINSPPRGVWEFFTNASGRWLCLFGLATFGEYGASAAGYRVKARRATLAARLGLFDDDGQPNVAAVKDQIARLKAAGVLEREPRQWRIVVPDLEWPADERPAASPPAWLLSMQIPLHVKRCAIGMWSFAPFEAGAEAPIVTPTMRDIADRTGQKQRTVRSQVREVIEHGLAERVGEGYRLLTPLSLETPNQPLETPPPLSPQPPPLTLETPPALSLGTPPPDTGDAPPCHHSLPPLSLETPQSLQLSCNDLALSLKAESDDPAQVSLFGAEAEPDRLIEPPKLERRDLAQEVVDYLNAQAAAIREWAGMPKSKGVKITSGRRKMIEARLLDIDDSDDSRIAEAKKVIDVQVHQVRSNGPIPSSDAFKRDLKMLRTSTLFREKNFDTWLDRWNDDGDHELWWQTSRKPMHRSVGANDRLTDYAERAKRGEIDDAAEWGYPTGGEP